jgi:hypothetical protein
LRTDATPAKPVGSYPPQQRAQADRDGHNEQMPNHRGPVETFDIGEPLRRP